MIRTLPKSADKLSVLKVWDVFVARRTQMEGWYAECRAAEEQHALAEGSIWRAPV